MKLAAVLVLWKSNRTDFNKVPVPDNKVPEDDATDDDGPIVIKRKRLVRWKDPISAEEEDGWLESRRLFDEPEEALLASPPILEEQEEALSETLPKCDDDVANKIEPSKGDDESTDINPGKRPKLSAENMEDKCDDDVADKIEPGKRDDETADTNPGKRPKMSAENMEEKYRAVVNVVALTTPDALFDAFCAYIQTVDEEDFNR